MLEPLLHLRGHRVTVMGLGRFGGGIAVARWLVEQGAKVLVTDRDPPERLADSLRQLDGLPIEFHLGGHRAEDFSGADLVVTSPAVAPSSEFLAVARAAGVPITTEIRLVIERLPAGMRVLGVTGSKGKSTTTRMLGDMLQRRHTVWVGGNLGGSLLPQLDRIRADHLVVLELSSYMLEYLREIEWSPHLAILTLLVPDHLEWHGSFEAYAAAKAGIFRFQGPQDLAIVPAGNREVLSMARKGRGRVIEFPRPGSKPFELNLLGAHNQHNAQAAFAAAAEFGIGQNEAQETLRAFAPLPHRLQLVHEAGGVRYVNDSIATIPEAAAAALEAFAPKTVIQIVGGADKHLPLTTLCHALIERAKAVACIGLLGPAIEAALSQSSSQHAPPIYRFEGLPNAMPFLVRLARPGDTILLSPGCPSTDQFVNFEARGDLFTHLARMLAPGQPLNS